jgi:hypothetical protein
MAEVLWTFPAPVKHAEGAAYLARACGNPAPGGTWHGWIEFVPVGGGVPIRSPRETTQPNRTHAQYWASGLTTVYLEGALERALHPVVVTAPPRPRPPYFSGPAAGPMRDPYGSAGASVLDPFSAFAKGEASLRRRLSALAAWRLAAIIREYGLSEGDAGLGGLTAAELTERIVQGVRSSVRAGRPKGRRSPPSAGNAPLPDRSSHRVG